MATAVSSPANSSDEQQPPSAPEPSTPVASKAPEQSPSSPPPAEVVNVLASSSSKVAANAASVSLHSSERDTTAERVCHGCNSLCTSIYFATDKFDTIICSRCYASGNYPSGFNSSELRRIGSVYEGTIDIDGNEEESFGYPSFERSDESEVSRIANSIKFPEPSWKRRKLSNDSNNQVEESESDSDSDSESDIRLLRSIVRLLIAMMSNTITATRSYPPHQVSGPTIKECMDILKDMSGIIPRSDIWNYSCNSLCKKEVREVFVHLPNDEIRLSWLKYNYSLRHPN